MRNPALNNPFDGMGLIELDKLFPIRKIAFEPLQCNTTYAFDRSRIRFPDSDDLIILMNMKRHHLIT